MRNTVTNTEIWKVRAAALRRMAQKARDVERERKMLALADQFEEAADAVEQTGTPKNDR